jgi:integrase
MGRPFNPLLLKREGLFALMLHDLRNTCGTILLMVGKRPKYVQKLPGHASTAITLDIYSHTIEGLAGALDEAV